MVCTPAHVAAVRGKFETQQKFDWKAIVRNVKKLYLERKYKLCAALCEETIAGNKMIHPLHKSFFHFHRAICYESLGIAAHSYSSNKIPFFNHAKDAFTSALDALPPPFATGENGIATTPRFSPMLEDSVSVYSPSGTDIATPSKAAPTPANRSFLPRTVSYIALPLTNDDEYDDNIDDPSTPDFDNYSPREAFNSLTATTQSSPPQTNLLTPNRKLKSKAQVKARLSQSLSDNHVLEDALVPSPLFPRKPMAASINTSVQETRPQNEIAQQGSRPLPPLPFNHKLIFIRDGTRHVQAKPQLRQTAMYPHPLLLVNSVPMTPSPVTPRFTAIRDAFTPAPSEDRYLANYLDSIQLTRYSKDLASFRTQILAHVSSVETRIRDVGVMQREHQGRDRGRVASYWMLPSPAGANSSGKKELDITAQERKARIERLRDSGWQVRKERHGWKGVEYYEVVRRRAESELRC